MREAQSPWGGARPEAPGGSDAAGRPVPVAARGLPCGAEEAVEPAPAPSDASDDPVLAFEDVTFSYGERSLIDGLSLAVPAGRVLGVVGPNGCGKSTLLRLADGLLRPAAGRVTVGGDDVAALPARERARRVALLPQIHRTPSMTVRELVMCGRYAHMGLFGRPGAKDVRAVDEALAEVGIADIAERPARGLSGGQRQAAFIAMAIAQRAGVLLLDEPTTYLDARAAHGIMGLVRRLVARGGTTAVAVIHDLDLALRTCDELAVVDGGRVRAQGSPEEVLASGALERAFGVAVEPVDTTRGRAYAIF